jgi:ComF family protein
MVYNSVKHIFQNFLSLFYPKLCAVCGAPLTENEKFLCMECMFCLPKTNYHLNPDNPAADCFAGKINIVKASSFLFYNKGGIAQTIVEHIKYHGYRQLGEWMGKLMAEEMLSSGFFSDIDIIVAVPLNKKKERKRGFNQAEIIAKGIADTTGIKRTGDNIVRTRANPTQTKKGLFDRWINTQNLFETVDTAYFADKHILLIDDVLTSGSTLEAVARAVMQAQNSKVSILTLAIA